VTANAERPPPQPEEEIPIGLPPIELAFALQSDDPLIETLTYIWEEICRTYDVVDRPPGFVTLFERAQFLRPYDAAETVIANMLLEIGERVDRFSPWYTQPAEAYGIVAAQGRPVRWRLTEQGCDRWWPFIESLATVIERNTNLIKAMMLVETSMQENELDEPLVPANCRCLPPRRIQVKRSILNKTEIVCDLCQQPFRPV
jgi:hypothetical protein